ncbi:MAG TPA: hypothetical protein VMF06_15360 [Candidatus Limnocylindria bacterium]|nr:hypothetical protein [Candidatus Limnocylindria bacterium]
MLRVVKPERLDELPPNDPLAVGSRTDIRRLNSILGSANVLALALRQHLPNTIGSSRPLRWVDLGGGDGTLLLQMARQLAPLGFTAHATIVDRHSLISGETRHAFALLKWTVESVAADVFDWLKPADSSPPVDVMIANLFLHHFPGRRLAALLRLVAARTRLFVACEPCRSPLALTAARMTFLLGCNSVTRHDAVVSVNAGFVGDELSALWPAGTNWELLEQATGFFCQSFIAKPKATA